MSIRMVTLTTFSNPIEAELARNRLEAEGIQAFLSGDTANNMFGAVLGLTIALQVRQADLERADRVLAELPRMGDTRRDFLADAARASGLEENEDNTAIKSPEWADAGPVEEDDPEARYRAEDMKIQHVGPVKKDDRIKAGDTEAPPARREERPIPKEADEEDEVNTAWKPDDYASRALKAAILGPLFCGGIFNLYSVYLLIRLAFVDEELSAAGMRKVYGALLIDGTVLGALALVILSMLR